MRARWLMVVALAFWPAACGDGGRAEHDAAPADGAADVIRNDGASSDGDRDSSPGDAGAPDSQGPIADASPDGGSGGYRAQMYFGGLNRLTIVKHEPAREWCVRLVLSSPPPDVDAGGASLTLPPHWGLIGYGVLPQSDGCAPASSVAPLPCTEATGTVSLPQSSCRTVDVDVQMLCPMGTSSASLPIELKATGLTVEGC